MIVCAGIFLAQASSTLSWARKMLAQTIISLVIFFGLAPLLFLTKKCMQFGCCCFWPHFLLCCTNWITWVFENQQSQAWLGRGSASAPSVLNLCVLHFNLRCKCLTDMGLSHECQDTLYPNHATKLEWETKEEGEASEPRGRQRKVELKRTWKCQCTHEECKWTAWEVDNLQQHDKSWTQRTKEMME